MRRVKLAVAAFFAISAVTAFAATTTTVADLTIPNGTVRVVNTRPDAPRANIIVLTGGGGNPNFTQSGDFANPEALINIPYRSRQHFVDRGYSFYYVDAPSYTLPNGIDFNFRASATYPPIIGAVLEYTRRQDNVPTWVWGFSAGTIGAVNAALNLPADLPFGLVLLSPTSVDVGRIPAQPTVLEFNLEGIRRPTLVVSHASDYCANSLPANTRLVVSRLTATPARGHIELTGGNDAGAGNECGSTGYMAMGGLEAQFVAAVVDWTTPYAYLAQAPNYTALWWNSAESGWGINLNHQGNIVFGTLFTYDASGAPLWLVMSAGALQSGTTYSGDLYRTTGPAFNANPFTPIGQANLTRVGTMSVTFTGLSTATLTYAVNGIAVTKSIQRQVYGTRAANCMALTASRASLTNYQDLWWNAAESGWGVNVTHQDQILFATLFTYDATGRDLWLVMSAGTRQPDGSYLGDLYRTTGPAFNANPFTPIGAGNLTTVGTMRFRFTDGNNGTLNYTYNGVSVTKVITRQVFASPIPSCS